MICSSCNHPSHANDRFCTHCGHALFQIDGPTRACPDEETPCLQEASVHLIRSHQLAGISDRGLCHVHNEDAIVVEHFNKLLVKHPGDPRSVLIVCDGVSSSTHPENASATAATIVASALAARSPASCPKVALTSAFHQAQYEVARLAKLYPHNPPATTIVAAIIHTDDQAQTWVTIGWLGDSRAYWISRDQSQLLTHDDSWLNAVRLSGHLSEAEALLSPYAHAITRWLGATADPAPSIVQCSLNQAGYLILCSDGFWNYAAAPDRIAELCQFESAPRQSAHAIAQTLVHHALSSGGHDNISVAVYTHNPQPHSNESYD